MAGGRSNNAETYFEVLQKNIRVTCLYLRKLGNNFLAQTISQFSVMEIRSKAALCEYYRRNYRLLKSMFQLDKHHYNISYMIEINSIRIAN